ncbi:DUF4279 domain-containing protein [Lentibacillus saliphilus]|uniref:DUF4279 domain-containing protein n=1 Tax=Lentibacillus saliphilus TaxID=2737028 RepID=UPI001C307D83|nr:DUF4279 domain-containing protein [Lentibacillus saliphilus]
MEKTSSYTYFAISSHAELGKTGYVAYESGIFNPDDITNALGIEPFDTNNYGDKKSNGMSWLTSGWCAEKSNKDRLDVEAQCLDTIKNLKHKIPILNEIKKLYDVHFGLIIVPTIYNGETPILTFNKEIVEFCYLTGTEIDVDMYVYPFDEEGE